MIESFRWDWVGLLENTHWGQALWQPYTLHLWIGLTFGYVIHCYVWYILAWGIFNIRLRVWDMTGGIFLKKTSFFSVAVTKCFLLHQPLDGDVILISCSSKCSLKSEQWRS
jgi:hypothetical protein